MPRREDSAPRPSGFSVNGMRTQSNNFLLDGASNNDTFNTGFVMRPPPDAIEEFKIQTHSYNAEFGRNSGSIVNVVTKAGTNEAARRGLGIQPRRRAAGAQHLRAGERGETEVEAEPVRRQRGRAVVKNRVFGFGYYEGFRNLHGGTSDVVVAVGRAASRRFRQHHHPRSADRPALPGQSHPGVAPESLRRSS